MYLPTKQETLLLQATLLRCDRGIEAYAKWSLAVDIDALPLAEQRLLPLLYEKLSSRSTADPNLPKMKGVSRYIWSKNQNRMFALRPFFSLLQELSIPCVLLKGAALIQGYYPHFGQRDMDDTDILIDRKDAAKLLTALRNNGWKSPFHKFNAIKTYSPLFLSLYPSFPLEHPKQGKLDIHWDIAKHSHVLHGFAEKILENAVETKGARIPKQEHLLFHVLHHAAEKNVYPTIRWVTDAYMILRKADDFSFETLEKLIQQYGVESLLYPFLAYLQNEFDLHIPMDIPETSPPPLRTAKPAQKAYTYFRNLYIEKKYRGSFLQFLKEYFGLRSKAQLIPLLLTYSKIRLQSMFQAFT